jgi:hypothetical protein
MARARSGGILAVGLAVALAATPAAGAVDKKAIAGSASAGAHAWRVKQLAIGWVGLQEDVASCYAGLQKEPSQDQAAYCIALDQCTVLDTKAFPPDLIPNFFRDPAFTARRDGALATTVKPVERAVFLSSLQKAIQPCVGAAKQTQSRLHR